MNFGVQTTRFISINHNATTFYKVKIVHFKSNCLLKQIESVEMGYIQRIAALSPSTICQPEN